MHGGGGPAIGVEGRPNQRAFTIERADGFILGAADYAQLAIAMLNAAREEFPASGVVLKRFGEPLF